MAGRVTSYSTQLLGAALRGYGAGNTVLVRFGATSYVALLGNGSSGAAGLPPFNDMVGAVETPYGGYSGASNRGSIGNTTSGWNAPSGPTGVNAVTMTNASVVSTLPSCSGTGGFINGVALCMDNSTAITTTAAFNSASGVVTPGTLYWVNITSQQVVVGNAVSIAVGALTLSED